MAMATTIRSWDVYVAFVCEEYPFGAFPTTSVTRGNVCHWHGPPPEAVWIDFIDQLRLEEICPSYGGMMG
jgi:hypothetical protein